MHLSAKIVFSIKSDRLIRARLLLLVGWITGMILGVVFAKLAPTNIHAMMRTLIHSRMSIVGGFLSVFFPLLITALVLYFLKPLYLVFVASCKAYVFGYISGCVCLAFGSAGWLLRRLFCFSAIWGNVCMLLLWLVCLDGKHERYIARLLTASCFLAVILLLNYFSVSPFLVALFDQ